MSELLCNLNRMFYFTSCSMSRFRTFLKIMRGFKKCFIALEQKLNQGRAYSFTNAIFHQEVDTQNVSISFV
ncbi:hypothetical protein FGO68_gene3682 [Halteria grandinella]|uniref:Uncharacterized protein n=1 Tax=Halteria grandinella TaxID=5974 RepID=A0A8J8NTH3_HALGN|nr:hypothetical protein FGO68_gene3682 [Halteria grandinella]